VWPLASQTAPLWPARPRSVHAGPQLPVPCPGAGKEVKRKTAAAMDHRFAPILYQHPRDDYGLSGPAKWYDVCAECVCYVQCNECTAERA
jgi:hypothetical protein